MSLKSFVYITDGKKRLRARVTFSYSPENDDELQLDIGEIIDVLKQVKCHF